MNIIVPNSIEIGGFTYTILVDKDTDWDLRGDNKYGDCSFVKQEIRVVGNMGSEHFTNTLLHELAHAIDKIYLSESLEEREIDGMTNGYHQVFNQLGIKFKPIGY